MTVDLEDQRVFERFMARFPVKFKDSRQEFGTEIFLRDASAQGLKLVTRERLFPNDRISLLVKLPDSHEPLTLNGQVVWAKNRMPGTWEIGLKFHAIRLMAVQRLFKYCELI